MVIDKALYTLGDKFDLIALNILTQFKQFDGHYGKKYKNAIYWYMRRIIREEEIPVVFQLTWLMAIWRKKRQCPRSEHDAVHTHQILGRETM
jgi:hypothetical protein